MPEKRRAGGPRKSDPTIVIGQPDREVMQHMGTPKLNPLTKMAARRVPNAVKAIKLCGNMASYKPSEVQRAAILKALREAVKEVETRFELSSGKDRGGIVFTLPE